MIISSRQRSLLALILGTGLIVTGLLVQSPATRAATTSIPLTGYAWSALTGWVHMNGTSYGVVADAATGALSGYAWSSNLGWITFNAADLSGCPSGSCSAQVDSTGALTGWARACAAFADKNACSGALDSNTGGWDGWIHLSGTAQDSTAYGVTASSGCWKGYAWGSQDVGALSFSGTAADGSSYCVQTATCLNGLAYDATSASCIACSNGGCTGPGGSQANPNGSLVCNDGATDVPTCTPSPTASLTANPTSVQFGNSTTLTWTSTNTTSCQLNGTAVALNDSTGVSSGPLYQDPSSSVLYCTGPGGSVTRSASVTVGMPGDYIMANPTRVSNQTGNSTQISWSAENVSPNSSCTITRNGAAWASASTNASGTVATTTQTDSNLTTQTVYEIGCPTAESTLTATASVTVQIAPTFKQF